MSDSILMDEGSPVYEFIVQAGVGETTILQRGRCADGECFTYRLALSEKNLFAYQLQPTSPRVFDLLDIAIVAYTADRLSPRKRRKRIHKDHDGWHRKIAITVPVRDLDFWKQSRTLDLLRNTLRYLTDDVWIIEFEQRGIIPRISEVQRPLSALAEIKVSESSASILFSGGLDSLVGLHRIAGSVDYEHVHAMTVQSTGSKSVRTASQVLEKYRKTVANRTEIYHDVLQVGIRDLQPNNEEREPSHRTRGFLFLVTGAVAANTREESRLFVCENGIGAINLPLSPDLVGARSTKAMHPAFLKMMEDLISEVIGTKFGILNLGVTQTKAQLLQDLNDDRLLESFRATSSCDRASRKAPSEHCGKCTSCVFRTVSVASAGLKKWDDHGDSSPPSMGDHGNLPAGFELSVGMIAYLIHASKLQSGLNGIDPWLSMRCEFPELQDLLTMSGFNEILGRERTMELYRSFLAELQSYPGFGLMHIT